MKFLNWQLLLNKIYSFNFLRLGYFEVINQAYSWQELNEEATSHYKTQVISKKLKVLKNY